MRALIVHAHHEPTSFNAAMTATAAAALRAAGGETVVSDLYAMGFDPVSDRRNFVTTADRERLSQQAEEAYASAHDGYAADLQAEMDKLAWCDLLILQFPIWWLGPPAILKGWLDRVLAVGRAYGGGRWFENGWLKGKRAMCAVTVGGPRELYSPGGFYAPVEDLLFPIHRGVFGFTGMSVVRPFVVYGPGRMTAEARRLALADYRSHLLDPDAARAGERAGVASSPVTR
jgi:NAD(P)H dehydrogenase (quinone)